MTQIPMIYYYEVYFWDEDYGFWTGGDTNDGKRRTAKGVILGETMGKAVDKLNEWYGAENIFDIKMYKCTDDEGGTHSPIEFATVFNLPMDTQEDVIEPNLEYFH